MGCTGVSIRCLTLVGFVLQFGLTLEVHEWAPFRSGVNHRILCKCTSNVLPPFQRGERTKQFADRLGLGDFEMLRICVPTHLIKVPGGGEAWGPT